MSVRRIALAFLVAVSGPVCAMAQQPQPAPQAQPAPQQQAAPQAQPQSTWDALPRMQLQRQFAGPLRDTVVQRWRDTADGTICYIYLPISAPHSPPASGGSVNYGSNTIGSINCLPVAPGRSAAPAKAK